MRLVSGQGWFGLARESLAVGVGCWASVREVGRNLLGWFEFWALKFTRLGRRYLGCRAVRLDHGSGLRLV